MDDAHNTHEPAPPDGSGSSLNKKPRDVRSKSSPRPKAVKGRWLFKPGQGAIRVTARRVCPICGGTSNCVLSSPHPDMKVEGGDACAVLCRRKFDAATGGDWKTEAAGLDGGKYRAGSTQGGGRIWEPYCTGGKVARAPIESPAAAAAREKDEADGDEAKRIMAEREYQRACGGNPKLDEGVDHEWLRSYFKGRGIDPAWMPGGKVTRALRFDPRCPVKYDFEGRGGTHHPLKRPTQWDEDGECVGFEARTLDQVPEPRHRAPAMVAAVISAHDKPRLVRGVHATALKRLPSGEVVKDVDRACTGNGRRQFAPCDGVVVIGAEGSKAGSLFPSGVAIVGEGFETVYSGMVATACVHTGLVCTDIAGICELWRVLKGMGEAVKSLHTLVILVELDKLRTSKGAMSRTGQRRCVHAVDGTVKEDGTEKSPGLRAVFPWMTVHLAVMRAVDFPELVKRVELAGEDLELAREGKLGCAVERAPALAAAFGAAGGGGEDRYFEDQPIDPGEGTDWNNALRLVSVARPAFRFEIGRAIMRGVDLGANEERAKRVIAGLASSAADGADGAAHASENASEPLEGDGGASSAGGGGGGGEDDGGEGGGGDDDERPEDDGSPDFWGPPRWGGYTWRRKDDKRGRAIISSRGLDRARLFLLQKCRERGDRRFRLAYWGGQWFWFDGGFWYKVTDVQVAGVVAEWLSHFWNRRVYESGDAKWTRIDPNERAVSEILAKLRQECFVDAEAMPAWLPDQIDKHGEPLWGESVRTWSIDREAIDPRGEASDYLVDREGMIRLSQLVDLRRGKRTTLTKLPHTPALFTSAARPYVLPMEELVEACREGWDDAKHEQLCPVTMAWLNTVVSDTPRDDSDPPGLEGECLAANRRKAQLGKMFGDSISGNREDETLFMVPGPRRAGKGVLLKMIIASHGRGSVQATSITKMGTQFGLYPLVGASVAVMGDAHVGQFADSTQAVENLKGIRGQDSVQVEGKGLHPQTLVLPLRFWIFFNDEPDKLQDNSGALGGSAVMWPLTQSFYGVEDPRIKKGVQREGAGIAVWGLAHYAELKAMPQPRIEMTSIAREVAEEFEDASSHMWAFAKECLMLDEERGRQMLKFHADRCVIIDALNNVYLWWCAENGRHKPYAKNKLIGKLRPLVNGGLRKPRQPVADDGSRKRSVDGIELRSDLPERWLQGAPPTQGSQQRQPDAKGGASTTTGESQGSLRD